MSSEHSGRETMDYCPFCGVELADLGGPFMDHIEESPDCRERFDLWRENVAGDMGGEWSG